MEDVTFEDSPELFRKIATDLAEYGLVPMPKVYRPRIRALMDRIEEAFDRQDRGEFDVLAELLAEATGIDIREYGARLTDDEGEEPDEGQG